MNRKNDLSSMVEALYVLNMARNRLVYDFKNKEPAVYLPMFKYENNPELMKLSIENYFTTWVNFHFVAWNKHYPDNLGKLFFRVIKELALKTLSNLGEIDPCNHSFISKLISSKVQLIDGLIRSGERDNEKYKALLLEYEKDKVLFEREINRLKMGL